MMAASKAGCVGTLWSRTAETIIAINGWPHDGGASAAFDGTTSQAFASSARSDNSADSSLGIDFGAGNTFECTQVKIYGPNDAVFHEAGGETLSVSVREHTSAPSTGAEGTEIGSDSWTDTGSGQTRTISCTGTPNRYVWARFTGGSASNKYAVAELELYGCEG